MCTHVSIYPNLITSVYKVICRVGTIGTRLVRETKEDFLEEDISQQCVHVHTHTPSNQMLNHFQMLQSRYLLLRKRRKKLAVHVQIPRLGLHETG